MEKSNSFIGYRSESAEHDSGKGKDTEGIVVIVDPFSTGAHLALEITKKNVKCVRVLSSWDSPVAALVQEGIAAEFIATIQHNDSLKEQDIAVMEVGGIHDFFYLHIELISFLLFFCDRPFVR